MIIAIDGGTTNTRFTLVEGGEVIDRIKYSIGVRDSINNGRQTLEKAVKDGISELLGKNSIHAGEISCAVFSGMIGSENGLYKVSHIPAPAGAEELKRGAVRVSLPDITDIPTLFIPGVKTFTDPGEKPLSELDIMRGEETELIGILAGTGLCEPLTIALPGSHMKIVNTDAAGKIISFRTTLSGELIRAAAENTILSQSLKGGYPESSGDLDERFLHMGYEYAKLHGVNEALFKIRVYANFIKNASPQQLYSFLIGAVLHDDIRSLSKSSSGKIVVSGSDPFRSAIASLLGESGGTIVVLPDRISEQASSIGADAILRCTVHND
ncbi:MAG: 2-dehydro-3-deoxygalactonokinase [Candidatus Flemingiibacterium sp.]